MLCQIVLLLAGIDLRTPGAADLALGTLDSVLARLDPETWSHAPGMQQYLQMSTAASGPPVTARLDRERMVLSLAPQGRPPAAGGQGLVDHGRWPDDAGEPPALPGGCAGLISIWKNNSCWCAAKLPKVGMSGSSPCTHA